MASNTVRVAFRDFLTANWSTTSIAWPNEVFDDPLDNPWIRATYRGFIYEQMSIGGGSASGNRWQESGSLYLAIMIRAGTGDTQSSSYAETLAGLFRGITLSGYIRVVGLSIGDDQVEDVDGNWWPLVLRVDWERG
jgi:hypothetical protein